MPAGVERGEGCDAGGGQGGNRGSGQTSRASQATVGPWQFGEQGRKSLEGFTQGENGVWLTFLRTDSRCSGENRSRGVQKGRGWVHI